MLRDPSGRRGRDSPPDWHSLLAELGVEAAAMDRAVARAAETGTRIQAEILAAGLVPEEQLYRVIARELDLEFVHDIDPASLVLHERDALAALSSPRGARMAMRLEDDRATTLLIAPDLIEMQAYIDRFPDMKDRLRVVAPGTLRQAMLARARAVLLDDAREGLFRSRPSLSARIVANAWQGACVGALLVGLPVALVLEPMSTLMVVHVVSTLFFFACIALRAAVTFGPAMAEPAIRSFRRADMPVYTVLVALYREANMVPQLLEALGKLVWPRSKLEIKLVCEADDRDTLAAIRSHGLRPFIEVVEVPAALPRTKPKALAYALGLTSGELVALFDAEDRPHPLQLIEAWQRFATDGDDLACLQAPLSIMNRDESLLSRMFWFEYSALFRGLLPWLGRHDLFIPLGGTSNHFRRRALMEVGGWDPYNVTEDADLGLRLKRFGYRIGTIGFPTGEDAPTTAGVWIRQRTRWFKGWLQTWLVHMRSPLVTCRELGLRSFAIAQLLMLGMVLSALVHPLLLVTGALMIWVLTSEGGLGPAQTMLLVCDASNIVCGYAAFLAMGRKTLGPAEREGFWKVVLMTPAYWMMMSLAAWRAVWQLYRQPHHWEKTEHAPAGPAAPALVSAGNPAPLR
jgi:cellulose synthase/poly-beta-1,6-N-acetylglucosamine synthase-like glycosyltransferase